MLQGNGQLDGTRKKILFFFQEPYERGAEILEEHKGCKISREDGLANHLIRTHSNSQRLK